MREKSYFFFKRLQPHSSQSENLSALGVYPFCFCKGRFIGTDNAYCGCEVALKFQFENSPIYLRP
jgi:hypothetical protein